MSEPSEIDYCPECDGPASMCGLEASLQRLERAASDDLEELLARWKAEEKPVTREELAAEWEADIMGRLAIAYDEPNPGPIEEAVGAVASAILDRAGDRVLADRWAQVAIHAARQVFFLAGQLWEISAELQRQRERLGGAPQFPDFLLLVLQEKLGEVKHAEEVGHLAMRKEWAQVAAVAVCGYVDAHASPLPPAYVLVDSLARGLDGDENAVGKLLGCTPKEARRICARVAAK